MMGEFLPRAYAGERLVMLFSLCDMQQRIEIANTINLNSVAILRC